MQSQKGNIKVVFSVVIVIVLVGFVMYFMAKNADKSAEDKTLVGDNIPIQKVEENIKKDNLTKNNMDINKRLLANFTPVSKTDSLQKLDLVKGTGREVLEGDTVSVHYTGALASNGEIFQSSKDFGTNPITFPLSGVIKGWTDGIPGMKIGGTRRLVIPSSQAYGATPPPGSGIPANADLVFDVELVDIK